MDLRYSRLRQHSCHRGKLDFCSFSLLADRQTRRHSDVVYIILLRVNRHLEEFRAARGTSRVSSFAFRGAIRLGLCVVVLPRRISTRLELSSAGPVRGTACARARFLVIGRLPPRPRSVPVNLLFPLGNFLFRESSRAGIDRSISAYSLIGGNRERLPVCVCVCVCACDRGARGSRKHEYTRSMEVARRVSQSDEERGQRGRARPRHAVVSFASGPLTRY